MFFGLLAFLFALSAVFMILLILIQKGKNSLGIGNLGGGNQMLFGSSGGQDFFQKATWVLGAILLFGSLGLAIWKAKDLGASSVFHQSAPAQPSQDAPALPMDD